jgi:hypothetical protein
MMYRFLPESRKHSPGCQTLLPVQGQQIMPVYIIGRSQVICLETIVLEIDTSANLYSSESVHLQNEVTVNRSEKYM